jgi:hypothetical protein
MTVSRKFDIAVPICTAEVFDGPNIESTLQSYPGWYTMFVGSVNRPEIQEIQEKGGPMLSDGGNSSLREQQIDIDSAEPPSLTDSCL